MLQKMILPENRSLAVKMMVRQFKKEKNSLHDLNNFSMHVLSLFLSLNFLRCLRSWNLIKKSFFKENYSRESFKNGFCPRGAVGKLTHFSQWTEQK